MRPGICGLAGVVVVVGLCSAVVQAGSSVDYLSAGAGCWIAVPEQEDWNAEDYFGKLSVSMYATVLGWKTFVSVPLALTVETSSVGERKAQLMLGDGRFWIGRRLWAFEPRLGMLVPLGYSTDGGEGWIGSGNAALLGGVALNNAIRDDRRLRLSGEVMFKVELGGGLAQWPSWSASPGAKISVMPSSDWVLGCEVLGSVSGMRWEWNRGQTEYGAGFVPHLFVERYIGRAGVGAKVGWGPSWKRLGELPARFAGSSLNVSIGVGLYP